MRTINELRTRDPFIVTDFEKQCYYLLCNNGIGRTDGKPGEGLDLYRTTDLKHFHGPIPVFRPTEAMWKKTGHGAPEVYFWKGHWYIFTQMNMDAPGWDNHAHPKGTILGVFSFRADKLEGPYEVWSDGPIPPWDRPTLDGTLFVDRDGNPWMIYAREWKQNAIGTFEAVPLTDDLRAACGDPVYMFSAKDPEWAIGSLDQWPENKDYFPGERFWVTDGCYPFYDRSGTLCLLWSTRIDDNYVTTFSRSLTNTLEGPWQHEKMPFYCNDGGHGMLFKMLDGRDALIFHQPDRLGKERMMVLPVSITECGLTLAEKME